MLGRSESLSIKNKIHMVEQQEMTPNLTYFHARISSHIP